MGDQWDLDEVSEFLVVAATLLDLKAAKLLPQADVEDDEDLALLEARDLLFARLLQYKAFKEAASVIAALDAEFSRGFPRAVQAGAAVRRGAARPGARHRRRPPRPARGAGPSGPKPMPVVSIDHIHMVRVSVREHAEILREKLLRLRTATFRALCADCQSTLEVVARFLALLGALPRRAGRVRPDGGAGRTDRAVDRRRLGGTSRSPSTSTGDEEPGGRAAEPSREDGVSSGRGRTNRG